MIALIWDSTRLGVDLKNQINYHLVQNRNNMSNSIEEEFQHMDEIEFREQKEIEKAISVDDPISTLNTNNIILVSKLSLIHI